MKKNLQIGFIGNERHLLHALRAMTRYGIFASDESLPYSFLLFGDFPKEILANQPFNFQYIGEDRVDLESFSDNYDLVIDPENNFHSGGSYALSQWFEAQLNLECSPKSAPFISSLNHFCIRGISFRLRANDLPVGNTVFIMPPSPQDADWASLPKNAGTWWSEAVEILDMAKYSIVYPQIKFAGHEHSKGFDYRMFFTGHEEEFCSRCYMPECRSMVELIYHLMSCRMYIGHDNVIADIAAALHIPSVIIHPSPRIINREVFSVRSDEYISSHTYFSNGVRWCHEKLRNAVNNIETRFIPFAKTLKEYDRIKKIISNGDK